MHCINAADNFDSIVLEFALYEEKIRETFLAVDEEKMTPIQ